jgi:hypothetical protein
MCLLEETARRMRSLFLSGRVALEGNNSLSLKNDKELSQDLKEAAFASRMRPLVEQLRLGWVSLRGRHGSPVIYGIASEVATGGTGNKKCPDRCGAFKCNVT